MLKEFFMKQAFRMKGMPKEQADALAKKISENPELVRALEAIEKNPELKTLLEKVQKETEEKIATGMDQMMASAGVMMKYKHEFAKYRDVLEPLMLLMQK